MTTPEPPKRHLPSHVFNLVVLVVGGVVLAVMMQRLGWDNARGVVRGIGAWAGVIFALDLAGLALDAAAIHAFMKPEARMVSYPRVVAATLSGRAVNALVPGGALGEAVKVTMLVAYAPRERVISSILLSNLTSFYASLAMVIVGVPFTLIAVDLPHELEVVVIVALAVLIPLVLALGWIIHSGALHILVGRFTPRWEAKLTTIDRHLRELHADRSPGTRLGMIYVAASRVVSWTALAVLLHAIGVALSATLLIGVLSVGVLIGWVSTFVPFGVGVADAGNYLLYDVLGATGAHGVFVTLLGRARAIALALLGLAVMAAAHVATRIAVARRRRHFDELRARKAAS